MTYHYRVRMTTIFHLPPAYKFQFLHFFLGGGVKGEILTFIFITPKRHHLGHNDVKLGIDRGGMSKCVTCGPSEEEKKKLSCVTIWSGHPRRHSPLKFCLLGLVWEIIIYFKLYENRSRGLGASIDLAHGLQHIQLTFTTYTTACTTVNAVIIVHLSQFVDSRVKIWYKMTLPQKKFQQSILLCKVLQQVMNSRKSLLKSDPWKGVNLHIFKIAATENFNALLSQW